MWLGEVIRKLASCLSLSKCSIRSPHSTVMRHKEWQIKEGKKEESETSAVVASNRQVFVEWINSSDTHAALSPLERSCQYSYTSKPTKWRWSKRVLFLVQLIPVPQTK